uniref:Uncharacterized protein n=1 Tax=Utricularia reniformis TaxID=192314 RepID=A0A1Y0B4E8_9LAMI|nr:hypothetical protein AEK19_MT2140 [Utricularia reniformis]ART32291.1 hypothetical protein AEK19_MT2140 [Utricularia reniformis]
MEKTCAAVIAALSGSVMKVKLIFGEANQGSKSVLRSSIVPIRLAASGNLFCILAFFSLKSLVHECDSLAGRRIEL